MNRRLFLSSLAAFAGAAVLDPEKLLWRPGAKLISIPAPPPLAFHPLAFDSHYWGAGLGWNPDGSPYREVLQKMAERLAALIDAEATMRTQEEMDYRLVAGTEWFKIETLSRNKVYAPPKFS